MLPIENELRNFVLCIFAAKKLRREVRIGTRGSKLALWQANYLQAELAKIGLTSSIHIIKTKGDTIQDLSFDKIEGKGFFTKEIENALLNNEIDLAVHSLKDLETDQPKGLCIAAIPKREDPADVLLINPNSVDESQILNIIKSPVIAINTLFALWNLTYSFTVFK